MDEGRIKNSPLEGFWMEKGGGTPHQKSCGWWKGKNSPPESLWMEKGGELTSRKLVDGEKKQRGGGGDTLPESLWIAKGERTHIQMACGQGEG